MCNTLLTTMRNLTLLVMFALTASGCGGPALIAPAKPASAVKVPAAVTEEEYARQREIFEALPLDHPDRGAYRRAMLAHLIPLAGQVLDRGEDKTAIEEFEEALSLYSPAEVYRGGLKHGGLADLARKFLARYAPRGDEFKVMLGLMVQLSLGGKAESIKEQYLRLAAWADETEILKGGQSSAGARTIRHLEKVAERWPSDFVIRELRGRYLSRVKHLAKIARRHAEMGAKSRFPGLFLGGYLLVRLYLRVGEIQAARDALNSLPQRYPQDDVLSGLLDQVLGKGAKIEKYIQLSSFFWRNEEEVGLVICRAAVARFPGAQEGWRCMGTLAAELELHLLAQRSLEAAYKLAPKNLELAQVLAAQHQRRLFEMVDGQRLDEATGKLHEIERFHGATSKRFGPAFNAGLARVQYAVGQGLYQVGRVEEAAGLLERALASELIPEAVIQLANIRMNLGKPLAAAELLWQVEKGPKLKGMEPSLRLYWEARLAIARGQAFQLGGREKESRVDFSRAAARWQMLTTMKVKKEILAEAFVHLAQVLYKLGAPARALDALDAAIDIEPDRKETYADSIALLVSRGHLPEALDAYHRALGRGEVTEYLKSYCSFWVVGLARRAGLAPDPLAMQYIRRLKGSKWYARLANLMLGKARYDDLLKEARTVGDRAELYYYEADRLLTEGKLAQARALWTKVLETRMMGFYEYQMSRRNLEQGPAVIQTQPLDRKVAAE